MLCQVQVQVKKSKTQFDKLKLDTCQKIDLLSASRCNMFSRILATYENTLVQFWEKTARMLTHVSECFRGYQHYEFAMLKVCIGLTIRYSTALEQLGHFHQAFIT